MQDPTLKTLDYYTPENNSFPGSAATKYSSRFSAAAMIVTCIGGCGLSTTGDFVVGLVFGLVMFLGWLLAFVAIVIAAVALWKSHWKEGRLALLFGISTLGISIVAVYSIRGPSLGNIH